MSRRELGPTGIEVQAIGLGGMPLSIEGRPSEKQACAVIRTFLDCGGDFIDTANVYCLDDSDLGHNERLINTTLRSAGGRPRVTVATKGGLRRPGGAWTVDGSPAWLRASCEQSLRDLGVECIELYQLHAVDPKVGLEESLGELVRLREAGKLRHIGLSNVSRAELETALELTPVASVQNRCNAFHKHDLHNGLVDFCAEHGIAYLPYSPVGGHHGHVRLPKHPLFQALARKYSASAYQVALAWLLAKGEHVIPIPGASRRESVLGSAAALDLGLGASDIAKIDALPDT